MYRDQSAADLRLQLVEGEVDPQRFRVFEHAALETAALRVDAAIIGASHYVGGSELEGTRTFTELVACAEVDEKQRAYAAELDALPRPLCLEFDSGITYRFEYWIRELGPSERLVDAFRDRVTSVEAGRLGLARAFPGAGAAAAETLVSVEAGEDGRGLGVETVHSYPNEGRAVFSRSAIVWGPVGAPAGRR